MNINELIAELNELSKGIEMYTGHTCISREGGVVMFGDVMDLVNEYKESNTPVLPEYVAEWFRRARAFGYTIQEAMDRSVINGNNTSEESNAKLVSYFLSPDNQVAFAKAWVTGVYKVEEPKRFILASNNKVLKDNYLFYHKVDEYYSVEHVDLLDDRRMKYMFTEEELETMDETGFSRIEVGRDK